MKKSFLISLIFIFVFSFSAVFASDVIKLGAKITEETYKESYSTGDTLTIRLTVDEACDNFGMVMGMFEVDGDLLKIDKTRGEGISIVIDGVVDGERLPAFFDVASEEKSNQVIFWTEDQYNEMSTGNIGRIICTAKKDFSAKDLKFSYINMKASDYDLKNNYKCESTINLVNSVENTKTDNEEKELEDTLNQIKEDIAKQEQEKIELITETILNEDGSKGIKKEDIKGSSKTTTSGGSSTNEKIAESKEVKSNFWSNASSWTEKELQSANNRNLIPEILASKDFTKPVSRKEFAAIAVKLYEYFARKEIKTTIENPFNDVNDEYVTKAYEVGITEGTDKEKGLFSPDKEITREQLATMIVRALNKIGIDTSTKKEDFEKFIDEDQMHSWGKDAIYFMFSKGIVKGTSTYENRFGVLNNATIEQALLISLRCTNELK